MSHSLDPTIIHAIILARAARFEALAANENHHNHLQGRDYEFCKIQLDYLAERCGLDHCSLSELVNLGALIPKAPLRS